MRVAELAVEYRSRGVVALGLGGDENEEACSFKEAFAYARDHGLGSVVHAGETTGPASIWTAIDDLGASRIGHGLAALRDKRLIDRLATDEVILEVCPTSNVATGVVPSPQEHPWPRLVAEDLRLTVNPDDPAMFHTNMGHELTLVKNVWHADVDSLVNLNRVALAGSFATQALRTRIEGELIAWAAEQDQATDHRVEH